ncbi:MAG: hypothetical protein NC078_00145 [Ruminococcus sp.]|nr:hypothetical protein [Ruminococcus sp.]
MNTYEKERLEEFERDVKKMQKELREEFAEFEEKKTPLQKLGEKLGFKKAKKKKTRKS